MAGKNKPQTSPEIKASWQIKIATTVLNLPRITRILIAGVYALATVLAITPIVDEIYLANFFTEDTTWLPAMITASIGLFVYMIGWRIIVGTVGETILPSNSVTWYLIAGLFAILMVAFWLFQLLTIGSSSLI